MVRIALRRGTTVLLFTTLALLLTWAMASSETLKSSPLLKWTHRTEGEVEIIQGEAEDLFMESRLDGKRMTSTLRSPTHLEVVEADQDSPFFTITVNGKSTTYDRRSFLVEEKVYDVPPPFSGMPPRNNSDDD